MSYIAPRKAVWRLKVANLLQLISSYATMLLVKESVKETVSIRLSQPACRTRRFLQSFRSSPVPHHHTGKAYLEVSVTWVAK